MTDTTRGRILEFLLLVAVCGSITFAIAYDNYESFSREIETAAPPGDTAEYLRAYLENRDLLHPGANVAFRDYRLVAPMLAHFVPDPPEATFRSSLRLETVSLGVFKFAVITAFFNFAACVVIYAICRHFQLSRFLSLFGAALYSTLTFVVVANGIPHVDAVFFFVFNIGAYAVLRRNLGLILITTLVGAFVKEAIFLLGILALLLPATVRMKAALIAAMVPGALAYVAVRYVLVPSTHDYFTTGEFVPLAGLALSHLLTLNGLEWIFMGFNFLWLPILWALVRRDVDPILVRWSLFVPILLAVTVLGGSDHFGRSLPLAAPVAIPLALLGILSLIQRIEALELVSVPGPDTARPAEAVPGGVPKVAVPASIAGR